MADRIARPRTVARLKRAGVPAIAGHVYDERYCSALMKLRDLHMTEDEMADYLGVEPKTFEHWRDTIKPFGETVRVLNGARRAAVDETIYKAAGLRELGEDEEGFTGSERMLELVARAENPDRYSKQITENRTTHVVEGVSKLLDGLSSASIDDHYSRPDYTMSNAQAVQLCAELMEALPEGYKQALRQYFELGLTLDEEPPAHLQHEEMDYDDPEVVVASNTGQWMIGQGIDPHSIHSGCAFTIDGDADVTPPPQQDDKGFFE